MTRRNLLSSTVMQMRKDACRSRHQRLYEAARERLPDLEAYPDLGSVLAILDAQAPETYPASEVLTRTLVLEHRVRKSPVWTHALFAAYFPMLRRLRARVVCSWSGADVDQVVLGAFSEALDQVDVSSATQCCAFLLRQKTARLVFRRLHRERDDQVELLGDNCFEVTGELPWANPRDRPAEVAPTDEILQAAGDCADLLRATILEGEPLRQYVERTVPGDDAARRRAYERLKRDRTRVLRKLRTSPRLRGAVAA